MEDGHHKTQTINHYLKSVYVSSTKNQGFTLDNNSNQHEFFGNLQQFQGDFTLFQLEASLQQLQQDFNKYFNEQYISKSNQKKRNYSFNAFKQTKEFVQASKQVVEILNPPELNLG